MSGESKGGTAGRREDGARIVEVIGGSSAERAGLRPGDMIVKAGRRYPRDVIDWQLATDGATCSLLVRRPGGREFSAVLKHHPGEDPGVRFGSSLFDGIRVCQNRCLFCFVDGLPRGLRSEVYVKDDDYRLSFLYGNFITLTNLGAGDVRRIARDRLSPLYVSIHSSAPDVRKRLLRPRRPDRALSDLHRLLEAGCEVHAQVVVCPGLNGGPELARTLDYLADARPRVASVGVVPVGVTRFTPERAGVRPLASEEAVETLDIIARCAKRERERTGLGWVYAADELYLRAGAKIPAGALYDGFPQIENGIGLIRQFTDDFARAWRAARRREKNPRARGGSRAHSARRVSGRTLVCTGELFAPVLEGILRKYEVRRFLPELRVLAVPNGLFGPSVTVAGLLSGGDLEAALGGVDLSGIAGVLVPEVALGGQGRFLDDTIPAEVAAAAGIQVDVIPGTGRALAKRLAGLRWGSVRPRRTAGRPEDVMSA